MTNVATVAKTIRDQVGFWSFAAVGAHDYTFFADALTFKVRLREKNRARVRIMHAVIQLDADDTYTVKVYWLNKKTFDVVNHFEASGIYADQLSTLISGLDS